MKVVTEKQKGNLQLKVSKYEKKEVFWAYLLIAPTFLGLMAFYMLPALSSFYLSFTDWNGLTAPVFNGVANFVELFSNAEYKRTVINTIVFTFVSVPLMIILATLIATLLNQKVRGMAIYRTLFFLPVVTMPIAVGMVWRWLYNSQYGLINYVLSIVGIEGPAWLLDSKFALFSIILASIWMGMGQSIIILLAGLQGIPESLYEAADLDGANAFRKFMNVSLPLLTPSLFFVLVISLIGSLQVFDLVFIMIGENSVILNATRTVVYGIYEQGFVLSNMGYASAQALLLFIIILLITIVQFILQKKWVHYE
ncbi:carbohydrate ABC transporter permease [Lederbergia lenta]|uniref:Sugar ABC transporter permease n=1 Tax=Lederbergia lenta TaxID=1467 RepID=A0A2X4ZR08_LEDLE|nr:sugar ABC transporter permease [Lederbergia lenta]MCM3111963.1 sugar ABC transporter permease [Lederbergia lenta]MEC2323138.1 sugar ABC transporter permease [Lederbergia lenta]SQI62804.1 sugar ABC transporter permease [Lederbergia lenta]